MKHILFAYQLEHKGKLAKINMSRLYLWDTHLFFQQSFLDLFLRESEEAKQIIVSHLKNHQFDFNYKNNLISMMQYFEQLYLVDISRYPFRESKIASQVNSLLHILKPYISSQLNNRDICNAIIEQCSSIEWIDFFCQHGSVSNFHTVCDKQPQLKEIIKNHAKWMFLDKFYEYCSLQCLPSTGKYKKLNKV